MSDISDWSCLPRDMYVVSVTSDGIVYDATMCSVPMAVAPEVRYVRWDANAAELSRLRAEVERLRAEAGSVRMCVNCGKTVPASHPRNEPLEECTGPDGLAACTFDTTPHEAWQVWRGRYCELERDFSTAREAGRQEGLEEAAKHLDAWSERHLARFSEKFQTHEGHAASVLEYAAEAIRALKEKQP